MVGICPITSSLQTRLIQYLWKRSVSLASNVTNFLLTIFELITYISVQPQMMEPNKLFIHSTGKTWEYEI